MQIAILVLCAVAVFFTLYIVCFLERLWNNLSELHEEVDKIDLEIFDMKYEVKPKNLHKEEIEEKDNA